MVCTAHSAQRHTPSTSEVPARSLILPWLLPCLLAPISGVGGSGPSACYTHCHALWIQCDTACGGGNSYQGDDCTIACLEEKASCFNACVVAIYIAGLLFPAFPSGGVGSGSGDGETNVGAYASVAAAAASVHPGLLPESKTRSRLEIGLNTDFSSIELAVGQADALLSTVGTMRLQHSVYEKIPNEGLVLALPGTQFSASDVRGGSQHWQEDRLFTSSRGKGNHEIENIQVSRLLGRWGGQESWFRLLFNGDEVRNIIQVAVSDIFIGEEISRAGGRRRNCDYALARLTVRSLRDAQRPSALLHSVTSESSSNMGQPDNGSVCEGASATIETHFGGDVMRQWVFQGCARLAYHPNAARAWDFGTAFDIVLECHLVGMTSSDLAESGALEWIVAGTAQSAATVGGHTYSGVLPVRYTFPLFTSDPFNGIPGHIETDFKNSDPHSALVRAVEELEISVTRMDKM